MILHLLKIPLVEDLDWYFCITYHYLDQNQNFWLLKEVECHNFFSTVGLVLHHICKLFQIYPSLVEIRNDVHLMSSHSQFLYLVLPYLHIEITKYLQFLLIFLNRRWNKYQEHILYLIMYYLHLKLHLPHHQRVQHQPNQ